ncbi:MAG: choice-of-anchor tandem repeat GloVer-containing protein [Limisphaerales bacterium]
MGGLILSGDTLYGTASGGGSSDSGTVFSIKTNGASFTVLHSFTHGDGSGPQGTLLLSGNTLYGTANNGGTSGVGTVFKVDTDGNNFVTVHNFTGTGGEGALPYAGLVLSTSITGNTLYGTTFIGSAVIDGYTSIGTVFAVDTDGNNFRTLHSFPGGYYAAWPACRLLLSGNVLYGTTFGGGGDLINHGTIFSIDTSGNNFTTLHEFVGVSDGANPYAGLIFWHGILYGVNSCSSVGTPGTIFSVRTNGTDFTTLYSFTGGSDGKSPVGELTLSGDTVYGTTVNGGSGGAGNGTVFRFTVPSPCAPATMNIAQYAGISLSGSIGCTYEIDYTTNLSNPTWIPLVTNTLSSSPFLFIDTNAISGSRFYRAVTQ